MKLKQVYYLVLLLSLTISAQAQQKAIPRDTSYNVNSVLRQVQAQFPMAVPAKDSLAPGVLADRDTIYTTLPEKDLGKRDLHLDIFRPAKAGKFPAVIMIHGGGWRSGTKSMEVPMAEMLAARGYVTITVEYQLSLEAKYPAAVYNIKSAIRWLRLNSEKYGIDTSHIAISGTSAGGQLAALVGLTNGIDLFEGNQGNAGITSKVHAVVDIDGVIDFLAPASLNLKRKENSPDIEWLGGSYEQKPGTWKEASPIFWATAKTAVPILFLNSGFSRFHAGQDELIGMMKEWNVYTETHKFDIAMHPFWLFHPWVDRVIQYVDDFLTKTFKYL